MYNIALLLPTFSVGITPSTPAKDHKCITNHGKSPSLTVSLVQVLGALYVSLNCSVELKFHARNPQCWSLSSSKRPKDCMSNSTNIFNKAWFSDFWYKKILTCMRLGQYFTVYLNTVRGTEKLYWYLGTWTLTRLPRAKKGEDCLESLAALTLTTS